MRVHLAIFAKLSIVYRIETDGVVTFRQWLKKADVPQPHDVAFYTLCRHRLFTHAWYTLDVVLCRYTLCPKNVHLLFLE